MSATVETTTVETADGRELCVEIAGGRDRAVLVHNGMPNSRHLYERWIEDAQRRQIQLISYDRPGYGRSTAQPGHSVADGAADVRAIAQALGIEQLGVWGISGGGPYAVACAALLPDLVVASAVLGSIAPWDAEGLDYFAGMGEDNKEDIQLYFSDREAARSRADAQRTELLSVTADQITEAWASLVSEVDATVIVGDFAEWLVECFRDGLAPGVEGWWDDGVASLEPWGFEFADVRVPVKVWHGRHDRFVPFQHGQWLAEHLPNAEANLSETDGHLTLIVNRVPEVHEWLLAHF
jgi:pimeloyl-ACP methyl ester carboxylesterase